MAFSKWIIQDRSHKETKGDKAHLHSLILTVVVTIFVVAPTPSSAQTYDLKSMAGFMTELREEPVLSALEGVNFLPVESPDKIPDWVQALFLRLEHEAFARNDVLKLMPCEDCSAFAGLLKGIIYVSPKFIKGIEDNKSFSDPRGFIAYVLAHELGHFVYEYSLVIRNNSRSLNGNMSLLNVHSDDMSERMATLVDAAHLEVDVYGLLLLKNLGLGRPVDADHALAGWQEDRLQNLKAIGPKIFGQQ